MMSKTQEALQKMVEVIKNSNGKVRHVDVENKVKSEGDFTQGHINGAFNQLRKKCDDYQISYKRIYGKSYFEYFGNDEIVESDNEFRNEVIKKSNVFLGELTEMKKYADNVQDFQLIQEIITDVHEIFVKL